MTVPQKPKVLLYSTVVFHVEILTFKQLVGGNVLKHPFRRYPFRILSMYLHINLRAHQVHLLFTRPLTSVPRPTSEHWANLFVSVRCSRLADETRAVTCSTFEVRASIRFLAKSRAGFGRVLGTRTRNQSGEFMGKIPVSPKFM